MVINIKAEFCYDDCCFYPRIPAKIHSFTFGKDYIYIYFKYCTDEILISAINSKYNYAKC